jgi:carbon storage regulator
MLVVSRKEDESVVIGNNIEVVIVRIDKNTVRVGIKAPKHISVHRKEVYEEIRLENLAASQAQSIGDAALQKLIGSRLKKSSGKKEDTKKENSK